MSQDSAGLSESSALPITPRITVLGAGYLGIAHAACMAAQGFQVLGVDVDAAKVAQLNAGQLPIFEPGVATLLQDGLASGRLAFTTSYPEAAAFGDVHFICVGTPQCRGADKADLSQLDACIGALAPLLSRRCLIVGKSTVPAGTAAATADRIGRLTKVAEVCWSPEFVREGHAVEDTLRPDRIVIGVTSPWAEQVLRAVYARQIAAGAGFFVTDLATAELAKVAANAFLATKISFINAVAEVCDAAGANISELATILGADPRIGHACLQPGLGFGGGCLPKDIRAFLARADELGAGGALAFLREVHTLNLARRTGMVDLACEMLGGSVEGKRVCVLGAAFKPGSDDVRDSPALDVAQILHGLGAEVVVHDPAAIESARRVQPELGYSDSVLTAASGADVVLLLTDWPEYATLDPAELRAVVAATRIIDGRYSLNPVAWRNAGWHYRASGIPDPAQQRHAS